MILAELRKKNQTWEQFLHIIPNLHFVFPVEISPTSNHPIQFPFVDLDKNLGEIPKSHVDGHSHKRKGKGQKQGGKFDPKKNQRIEYKQENPHSLK